VLLFYLFKCLCGYVIKFYSFKVCSLLRRRDCPSFKVMHLVVYVVKFFGLSALFLHKHVST